VDERGQTEHDQQGEAEQEPRAREEDEGRSTSGALQERAGSEVRLFAADGKLLGSIPAPVSLITAAFAGKDKKTVYAVTSLRSPDGMQRAEVYSIPMIAQGFAGRAK